MPATVPSALPPDATPVARPIAVALVRVPVAPMLAEPRVSSAQLSQTLFGHVAWVVDEHAEWRRLRTLDDYEGWTHRGYLELLDDAELLSGLTGAGAGVGESTLGAGFDGPLPCLSLGCTVAAGARRLRLPAGAWVHAEQEVLDGEAVPFARVAERFPRRREALAASAAALWEGTSYQWGGVTPWGADCSGFVQALAGVHGIALPRDAWQQALVGHPVAGGVAAADAGDLLFFSDRDDGRVTHVGLALGGGRMAHLALGRGGWAVDDLADSNDPYVARLRATCVGARRIGGD